MSKERASIATLPLPAHSQLTFQTKLALAVEFIDWLLSTLNNWKIPFELIVDGAYANHSVLEAAARNRITVTGRLRRNACLWSLPQSTLGRGRPRKYGKARIRLGLWAGQRRGWQEVEAWQYGKLESKKVKSF